MPRDMKLIWKILGYVSDEDHSYGGEISIPNYEQHARGKVLHHLILCEEAGYIELNKEEKGSKKPTSIKRMTWAGYEALEAPGKVKD